MGKFTLEPSRDRLKAMTINQLKKVEHVKVSNIFGTVEFLEPISLYKMDLVSAIKICQDNIEILDPELEEKKVQMTFVNFGGFLDLKSDERTKLLKRMRMWIDKFEME